MTQLGVDGREHHGIARRAHRHAGVREERLRVLAPDDGRGQNVDVVRDEDRQAGNLRQRLTQVALPQGKCVDLALVAAEAKRGCRDLERITIDENDDGIDRQGRYARRRM